MIQSFAWRRGRDVPSAYGSWGVYGETGARSHRNGASRHRVVLLRGNRGKWLIDQWNALIESWRKRKMCRVVSRFVTRSCRFAPFASLCCVLGGFSLSSVEIYVSSVLCCLYVYHELRFTRTKWKKPCTSKRLEVVFLCWQGKPWIVSSILSLLCFMWMTKILNYKLFLCVEQMV